MDNLKQAYDKYYSLDEEAKREKIRIQILWDKEHPAEQLYRDIIYPTAMHAAISGLDEAMVRCRKSSDYGLINKHFVEIQSLCEKDRLKLKTSFNKFYKVYGWAWYKN